MRNDVAQCYTIIYIDNDSTKSAAKFFKKQSYDNAKLLLKKKLPQCWGQLVEF